MLDIDISNLAILVIYPDGTFDSVPIEKYEIHMPYFRELRKKSPIFRTITEGLDFSISIHDHVDRFLAKVGIVLIYNVFLYVDSNTLKYNIDPLFVTCLPTVYGSKEQKETFYKIIRSSNVDNFVFGRYDTLSGDIKETKSLRNEVLSDELMSLPGIGERK